MDPEYLTAEQVSRLDFSGWSFLHQQGWAVCRGFVDSFQCDETHWSLRLKHVEYWDQVTGHWRLEKDQDEYRSTINAYWSARRDPENGIVSIPGYGMETHLAPVCQNPWGAVDWPETDGCPGGPMG